MYVKMYICIYLYGGNCCRNSWKEALRHEIERIQEAERRTMEEEAERRQRLNAWTAEVQQRLAKTDSTFSIGARVVHRSGSDWLAACVLECNVFDGGDVFYDLMPEQHPSRRSPRLLGALFSFGGALRAC